METKEAETRRAPVKAQDAYRCVACGEWIFDYEARLTFRVGGGIGGIGNTSAHYHQRCCP